jgi:phosphate transport system substrate-binding protein
VKKIKGAKKIIFAAVSAAAIAAILLFMASCGIIRAETAVIVAGSTSVQPYVEVLAEEYYRLYQNIADVQGGGSSMGITAVNEGTANIGMSSRPLRGAELELWSVEIARDALAIIVHPQNPVKNLTLEEIRRIYTGEINNWSMVGGKNREIYVVAREEGSGTRGAFEELVMGESRITQGAITFNSNGAVRQTVSSGLDFIGFISLGLVNETVSAIELNGVEASRDNVMNGSYELFRSFIFVTIEEPESGGAIDQFIRFILSPEGQEVLKDEGLIPGLDVEVGAEID